MTDYLQNKTVLITGAARGIGFATARFLGGRGANIVLSDILDETLAEARSKLAAEGIAVLAQRCDITNPDECRALVAAARERFGKIDILINNAGVSIVNYFENLTPAAAKKLVDVNVMGSIYMSLAALEALKASRGHLIFVASVAGIRAIPTGNMYGPSKSFLRSLAESLRLELKKYGIHVGVISPGFTTTEAAKTVMKGDGAPRPINRPPHDTPEGVAKGIAKLIERRERERVLTALGKLTLILQRLSPSLLDILLEGRELKN